MSWSSCLIDDFSTKSVYLGENGCYISRKTVRTRRTFLVTFLTFKPFMCCIFRQYCADKMMKSPTNSSQIRYCVYYCSFDRNKHRKHPKWATWSNVSIPLCLAQHDACTSMQVTQYTFLPMVSH